MRMYVYMCIQTPLKIPATSAALFSTSAQKVCVTLEARDVEAPNMRLRPMKSLLISRRGLGGRAGQASSKLGMSSLEAHEKLAISTPMPIHLSRRKGRGGALQGRKRCPTPWSAGLTNRKDE